MLRNADVLTKWEKDLVNGYCRIHASTYIPDVVTRLSMLYLYILDSFAAPHCATNNTDLNNEQIECDDLLISGLNQTRIECKYGNLTSYVFGTARINANVKSIATNTNIMTPSYLYHWRFQITAEGVIEGDNHFDFVVGLRALQTGTSYCFVGSHGLKVHGDDATQYTHKRFDKKHDILDMYLQLRRDADGDTQTEGGELSFILNNEALGVAFAALDPGHSYQMQCALTNRASSLELVAYHQSPMHPPQQWLCDAQYAHEYMQHIGSVPDTESQRTHLLRVLREYGVQTPHVCNAYLDCLVIQKKFKACFDFLASQSFRLAIETPRNLKKIGTYFYFTEHDFEKALRVFQCLRSDEQLLEQHVTVELAFCYEQHAKKYMSTAAATARDTYRLALKYYELSLAHENKLQEHGRSECLHHMAAIYFNYLDDHKLALQSFLQMGDAQIHRRDLESVIATCYDQLRDYDAALKYFTKYQTKYPDKPSVIIAIACLHFKCNNARKAEKYFQRAFALDGADSNWMINIKYGYFLLNEKHEYRVALRFFQISARNATTTEEKSESYKCIGATYDRLGEMERAIEFTDKVLAINDSDADALNNAGYFYLAKRHFAKALSLLRKSLDIYPDGELTTGNIGVCLYEMKQYAQALPYLQRVVEALPVDLKHPDVGPKVLHYYARILFKQERNFSECVVVLQQLIKHEAFESKYERSKDEIFYLLSRAYCKLTDFPSALKFLSAAYQSNPNRQIYQNQIEILKNSMIPNV